MTPNEALLLRHLRLTIVELESLIFGFEEKGYEITMDGQDVSAPMVQRIRGEITRLEEIVAKVDPEGWSVLHR